MMAGNLLTEVSPRTPRPPSAAGDGWTPGRVIALMAGSLLALVSLAFIAGGGALTWADAEQLHSGYLTTGTSSYSTSGYALASDPIDLHGARGWLSRLAGQARIRVTSADPSRPVFAGIAAAGDVQRYLAGVSYTTVGTRGGHDVTDHPGTGVPPAPAAALPWAAHAAGTGHLTLTWTVAEGDWMVVVMNSGATPGLVVRADAGVSSPALPWLAGELLAAGVLVGVAAAALIIVPVRLASRPESPDPASPA
jgi:hypothetical protein